MTLRGVMRDLRRSLWVLLALLLAGVLVGVAYSVAVPALPSASAYVRLPPSNPNATVQSAQSPQTDEVIALSPTVLVPAARQAHEALSYQTLQQRVSVTTPGGSNILQITARAPTAKGAVALANAILARFVFYVNSSAGVATAEVQALESAQTSEESSIKSWNSLIRSETALLATEPKGSTLAAATLSARDENEGALSAAEAYVTFLGGLIDQDVITASGPAVGAVPLSMATFADRASSARPFELAGLGLLVGLVIGLLVALVRARLDRRLRSRDDIARAAGAPVLTSLSPRRLRRAADWQHLLDRWRPTLGESARL
ncbi:MAG TPA: Wzz/FepE/Etk N-terminal domain-containing protein, partial [Acidimicrobiales bacterium]|nr:Wzz/FepE/Etk N-terminal domain-containing protein [Acidimicrobiales bacterium]